MITIKANEKKLFSTKEIKLITLLCLMCFTSTIEGHKRKYAQSSKHDLPCLDHGWKIDCTSRGLRSIPGNQLSYEMIYLEINDNDLGTLPRFAPNRFPKLYRVDAARCKLRDVEEYAFLGLDKFEELDLQSNELTEIPRRGLYESKVSRLNLAGNKIDKIDCNSFSTLRLLNRVDLSHNRIESIDSGSFASNLFISEIDLSHNQLTNLRPQMFLKSRWLVTIRADYNPIDYSSFKQEDSLDDDWMRGPSFAAEPDFKMRLIGNLSTSKGKSKTLACNTGSSASESDKHEHLMNSIRKIITSFESSWNRTVNFFTSFYLAEYLLFISTLLNIGLLLCGLKKAGLFKKILNMKEHLNHVDEDELPSKVSDLPSAA